MLKLPLAFSVCLSLPKTKYKKAVELKKKLFSFQEDFRVTIKEPRIARLKNRNIPNP